MAVMALSVLSSLVLCVVLLPAVWGVTYSCSSYRDKDDFYHVTKECGSQYCCGNCSTKYCCSEKKSQLTQQQQAQCAARFGNEKNIVLIFGAISGCIFGLFPCWAMLICCVTPCCLIYKKRQERRIQRQQISFSILQQPLYPPGNQLSHPGYQSVPVQPGFGDPPLPTAPPPSYLEATDPAHFPAPFTQGHPMYPFQPPGQPNVLSPHLAKNAQ